MNRWTIRKLWPIAGVGVGAIVILVSIAVIDSRRDARGDREIGPDAIAHSAIRVEAVQPTRRALTRDLQMPATLLADRNVDLYAKVSGYIRAVHVDIGSRVTTDQRLVALAIPEMADDLRQAEAARSARQAQVRALQANARQAQRRVEIAQAELQRQEAMHELDEITLKRQQELRAGNAISAQAFDEASGAHKVTEAQLRTAQAQLAGTEAEKQSIEAEVEVAKAEAAVAEANIARLRTLMNYAEIKAPFDGTITARLVDPGDFVRSAAEGTTPPLLTIAKTDRIRMALDIPEPDAPFITHGTAVRVRVKALGNASFDARVSRLARAIQPKTRTMRVEVDLDNTDGQLLAGMYAQVAIELETKAEAVLVPSKAIRVRGRETSVLVAQEDMAREVPIDLGYDDGIWAEVVSGLNGDEWVIVSASGTIASGTPIALNPATSAGP